ncbi:MAG: hypothetical protein A2981_01235 [Candidatus Nealsonbacteria bacterium RIFCSPLOWO2_01_FULL_38_120]|nr:MAG: hypothetical protein A2981_01235 [Candidatus Nealsonbacteria bacterium RIFCSPLOWO2_01_FULL_38_120]
MQSIRLIIIFDIIPRSVGVSENVFSFTPPSLRNYSKFAAEIWRKDQESLFLFGILYFKVIKYICYFGRSTIPAIAGIVDRWVGSHF